MTAQITHSRRDGFREMPARLLRTPDEIRTHDVVAQFSHELRNSLGIIRNAAHVLGKGAATDTVQERSRVLILRQVDQMKHLVDDLLDVSRMRNGRLHLRLTRTDLCVVIIHALQAVDSAMKKREHRLVASLPNHPVWLLGDAARLEQVFVNLLMNAAKYTPAGGEVTLSVTHEAKEVVVAIRDTGIGISADILPKVFDLYVQANPSSRNGGLGLGLPLVRSLVEGHGGSVTAASAGIGSGSEFIVRLPAFGKS